MVRSSRQWKGGTANFNPLSAEIEISYQCSIRPDDRLLAEGVTVIRIKDPAKVDEEKVFHFDVEVGGWHEMINGTRREIARYFRGAELNVGSGGEDLVLIPRRLEFIPDDENEPTVAVEL